MKLNSKSSLGTICVLLSLASTQVSALTLGRMRGGALLGKELDVTVVVQFVAEEEVAPTCFTAVVAYGENPLERSRVTLQTQSGPSPNTQLVRILANAQVNEAVVTVNLMAVCGAKTSRRYVLLADMISETDIAPAPLEARSPATVPAEVKEAVAPPLVRAATGTSVDSKRRAKPEEKKFSGSAATKALGTAKSESDAVVKASNQANLDALADLQRRVGEIEKWQATSTVAEELLKSQARENVLEENIKGLNAITSKNQQNLQTVAIAIENSESHNYGGFLVYALGALLLACLGACAYVYTRLKRSGSVASPWWSGGGERPLPSEPLRGPGSGTNGPSAVANAVGLHAAEKVSHAQAGAEIETNSRTGTTVAQTILDSNSANPVTAPGMAATVPAPVEAGHQSVSRVGDMASSPASIRTINTKEMLDVRQQAEFFMALGQHEGAVKVLADSISSSDDANPLVYLDLLKILHTLSRRADFERYRADFNQQFTARVPEYSNFLLEGNGLEAYEDICKQIVVLWPTDYTVDFIEQCLVRLPEDDPEQGIDLEAFKDLLLLYGVLKRLDQTVDSAIVPFSSTRIGNSQIATLTPESSGSPTLSGQGTVPPLAAVPAALESSAEAAAVDLSLDLDLDLSLDVGGAPEPTPPNDNLINFDMTGYGLETDSKPPPKK